MNDDLLPSSSKSATLGPRQGPLTRGSSFRGPLALAFVAEHLSIRHIGIIGPSQLTDLVIVVSAEL